MKTSLICNLSQLLQSSFYDSFTGDKLGNDLFINDPERANRIAEHAENGGNGSTHAEAIEDMAEANDIAARELYRNQFLALGFCGDTAAALADTLRDEIAAEIKDCEKWHAEAGTLHSVIG